MRVAQFDMASPDFPVSVVERDDPKLPRSDWARVEITRAGICGSDLHTIFGGHPSSSMYGPYVGFPPEMGHEIAGRVIETGPDCAVPVGTIVAVDPTLGCATRGFPLCRNCAVGAPSACEKYTDGGLLAAGFGVGFTTGLGAGWGDQMVAHESQLHVAPLGLTDPNAIVLAEPLSISVHGILRRAPQHGEPVLIIGAGIIGLAAVASVRDLCPDSTVIVLARHAHQATLATQLGAHHVVTERGDKAIMEALAAITGAKVVGRKSGAQLVGGIYYTYEAVGTGESIDQALRYTSSRGVIIQAGVSGRSDIDLGPLYFKELTMIGTLCHCVDSDPTGHEIHSFDRALNIISAGGFPSSSLVTHEFALDDFANACRTAHDKASGAVKVVLRP